MPGTIRKDCTRFGNFADHGKELMIFGNYDDYNPRWGSIGTDGEIEANLFEKTHLTENPLTTVQAKAWTAHRTQSLN